jgi:nuclear pore complex protein Nup160
MRGIRFPSNTPPPVHHDDLQPLVSYHAIHAHLPSGTSSKIEVQHYNFPYEQLDVDDIPLPEEEDATNRQSQLLPEHALSVSYSPECSTLARVIGNGKTLELRYIAPTSSRKQKDNNSNIIRISFTSAIHDISASKCFYRPTSNDNDSTFTIVIIDKKSRIHRLTFPNPHTRVERGLTAFEWNVKNLHVGWLMMSEQDMLASGMTVRGDEPLVWNVVDEDNLIIAVRDGLLRCTLVNEGEQMSFSVSAGDMTSLTFGHPLHNLYLIDWTHEYFRRPSSFRMFRSDPASQTRVISFQHDPITELVYAITRDKKLRIWNAQTLNHESVIDLAQTGGSSEPRQPQSEALTNGSNASTNLPTSSLVQILPGTKDTPYDKYIVVFTPTPRSPEGAGYFQVFGTLGIKKDISHVGFFTCSSQTVGMDFRGFNVEHATEATRNGGGDVEMEDESTPTSASSTWRLWAAWDLKGKLFLEWSDISTLFEPKEEELGVMASNTWKMVSSSKESLDLEPMFDSAYFDALNEGIEDGSLGAEDVARYFVDHLFYPGRFSQSVLKGALEEYSSGNDDEVDPMDEVVEEFRSLRDQIGQAVGRHLVPLLDQDLDAHEHADLLRRFKLEWQAFWIMVQQRDIQGRWPISLVSMVAGGAKEGIAAMVLCREGLVVPVVEDDVAYVRRLMVNTVDADLEELEVPVEVIEKDEIKDLLRSPSSTLEAHHPGLANPDVRSLVVTGMASASMLAQSIYPEEFFAFQKRAYERPTVSSLAGSVSQDFTRASDQDMEVPKPLRDSSDPRKVFHATLDLLVDLPREQTAGDLHDTFTGLSLKVSTFHQIVATRQLVASEVLLLACHMLSGTSNDDMPEHKNVYFSIAHRALAVFHAWETLRRLSEKHSDESQHTFRHPSDSSREGGHAAFIALREEWKKENDMSSCNETAYSLVHAILAEKPQSHSGRELTPKSLTVAAFRNLLQFGLITDTERIEAGTPETILALDILLSGNIESCLDFIESYPRSAGVSYVASRATIIAGADMETAVDGLNNVAAALGTCHVRRTLSIFEWLTVIRATARPGWAEMDRSGLVSVLPDRVRWNGLAEYYHHAHSLCKTARLTASAVMFAKRSIEETADPHATQNLMRYVFKEYLAQSQYEEAWQAMLANPLVNQ